MANNRMTEGVGKKIVEALKMQSDVEITPIQVENIHNNEAEQQIISEPVNNNEELNFDEEDIFTENETTNEILPSFEVEEPHIQTQPTIDLSEDIGISAGINDFETPANVAVLKQLITKLPAGVTKQTGAIIIKQTMEALGISMKSVLQEAQMAQEGLTNSARACQASILEHKKQIGLLEKQAQKYQRQYAALNDIISLFVQTNI